MRGEENDSGAFSTIGTAKNAAQRPVELRGTDYRDHSWQPRASGMRNLDSRIRKLENRFCDEKPQRLWVACLVGWGLALDRDRCIEILGECGFLPTGRFGLVNLCQIPNGLNARDLERFLRARGAETHGFHSAQDQLNRQRSEG